MYYFKRSFIKRQGFYTKIFKIVTWLIKAITILVKMDILRKQIRPKFPISAYFREPQWPHKYPQQLIFSLTVAFLQDSEHSKEQELV